MDQNGVMPWTMGFGGAIMALKNGQRVSRKGWNGKGMWLMLCANVEGTFTLETGLNCKVRDYIYMKTANDELVPWTASQSDVLAEDWEVVS